MRPESPGEIMFGDMAIDEEHGRDEFLVIVMLFFERNVGSSTGEVPMEEPFFRAGSTVGSGGGFVHKNVEDWTGRPSDGLSRDSALIGDRETGGQGESHVILVAATDGFPIGRLQLKPFVITLSGMLSLVCRATKDLGPLQIGIQRADFGRRRAKIFESPWILSAERIDIVLAFAIGFEHVRRGKLAAIVIRVKHDAGSNLSKITQALRKPGLVFRPRKRRKKKTRHNSDDRDDNEKLDKRESS